LQAAVSAQFGISTTEVITVQAGGLNAYGPPGSGASKPLVVSQIDAIKKVSNVDLVLRRNIQSGKLEYNKKTIFGFSMNIPENKEERDFAYDTLEITPIEGKLLEEEDQNKVVLGYNFYADKVGLEKAVHVGDTITIQNKRFQVKGIVNKKGSFIFDNIVLIKEDAMEEIMGYGDNVDIIVVKLKNKDLMEQTKKILKKL